MERRKAAEEAEARAKASATGSRLKGKFAKNMVNKIAVMEDLERKRREEEELQRQIEE